MEISPELIRKCIKKDRKAQFRLYKKCYGVLMSVCMRYKKNKEDAEGVLNQGFLKILKNLDSYKETTPFEAWIRRIMINTIIDEYRKNKKRKELTESTDFQDSGYENKHIDYNEADQNFDAEELEEMLKTLPPVTMRVFNLYAIDGYSHKEIGVKLGISEGTSKWHVSSARKKLKELVYKKLNSKKDKSLNG